MAERLRQDGCETERGIGEGGGQGGTYQSGEI